MLFFFDEAGSFAPLARARSSIAVCAGMVLPESSVGDFEAFFSEWRATLSPKETRQGEPKGALLRPASRQLFFDLFDGVADVLTQPVFIDLALQQELGRSHLPEDMRQEGLLRAPQFEDPIVGDLVDQLARRFGNLSESQILHLITLAHCIELTLRHALLFRAGTSLRSCWERILIRIDRTTKAANSREELVLRDGLPTFLVKRSERDPLATIQDVVDHNHPIERNFAGPLGFDTRRMLGNMEFVESSTDPGIQAADVLANSTLLALTDLNNVRGHLPLYRRVMRHCPLGAASPHIAPIVIGRPTEQPTVLAQYSILGRILESGR